MFTGSLARRDSRGQPLRHPDARSNPRGGEVMPWAPWLLRGAAAGCALFFLLTLIDKLNAMTG